MESEEGLFGAVLDDEQRIKLGRIQAFMAAAEGYGDHVMQGARPRAPAVVRPDPRRRCAATARARPAIPVFERLLGIEMKREQYAQGAAFCDTVVELTDEATLALDVGLGRGHAVAPRDRRAAPVARPKRLTPGHLTPTPSRSYILARAWQRSGNWSPPPSWTRASGMRTARTPATASTWSASPGRALPFVFFRAWKVPTGFVNEEIRLIGPSGRTIFRWGPEPRRMVGAMDLTTEVDTVDGAVFDETGTFVASFMLNGEIVGEIEVPVFVQSAPDQAAEGHRGRPEEVRRDLGRHRGAERPPTDGARVVRLQEREDLRAVAAGARTRGADDPGRAGRATELLVITRRKLRDTELEEFYAAQRRLEGPEWEEAAKLLVDRRKSRAGPPAEALNRWREDGATSSSSRPTSPV